MSSRRARDLRHAIIHRRHTHHDDESARTASTVSVMQDRHHHHNDDGSALSPRGPMLAIACHHDVPYLS